VDVSVSHTQISMTGALEAANSRVMKIDQDEIE
jgi:hypothetical protein